MRGFTIFKLVFRTPSKIEGDLTQKGGGSEFFPCKSSILGYNKRVESERDIPWYGD